ncbi:MAG: response regulator transcription factor [Gammaproteobacteria bacterium]|jgi:DNA-binding NarL/FixJ family response regulator|nr:response regulator transcription factor [Gammaproteobacteria bacterium]MBT3722762.1 response regulator transcription factor [Gammaproteobacteria bacterium]MBT4195392.1 response regulator transcription factor [Gammaproteobacteria bacterium]MBT4448098.1 response regulator transcription factor [Gammaproteobacteria bacterium]MBT4860414.1 response regulator transcription factor [Gammaproteobacteria bacterium]
MTAEITRILVIDDHPLLREGVSSTLDAVDDFEVIGQGGSYSDAITMAHDLIPDTILLDISMPGGGVEAARELHETLPSIKLIMLTASEDEKDVMSALQAGANAYILKGIGGKELIKIVRQVSAGETFITPSLATNILVHSYNEEAPGQAALQDKLNKRESEILKALERGLTNKQIAEELFLSEKTIKHYMTNILQKLQVKNRVEAALIAQKMHHG